MNEVDDLEDDEETLQLKLAAIEAKLKLKKLQQNRQKSAVEGPSKEQSHVNRPQSATSTISAAMLSDHGYGLGSKSLEVPVSPTRKTISQVEQRSPGRILLGIDKGVKGPDVSLRRARSVREMGTLGDNRATIGTTTSRSRTPGSGLFLDGRSRQRADRPVKTFSERMSENRAQEQSQEKRREALASKRGVGFKLNVAEMESYKKAAAEACTHSPPRSLSKDHQRATFSREDVLRSQRGRAPDSGLLTRSSTLPNFGAHSTGSVTNTKRKPSNVDSPDQESQSLDDGLGSERAEVRRKGDSSLYEPFSQLHLSGRVLPHSFLERTFPLDTHACVRLSQLLKQVKAPAYELPGLEAKDIVIVGVVASKSTPFDHKQKQGAKSAANEKRSDEWEHKWDDGSQNQKRFMVLQLSDLTWSVDLYLFGTALPRYHRLSPGTVVAILNPGIMPPRKGKEDTGAFSLTLHHGEDTLLEIGTARDLGFCSAVKKDGQECGSWVNLVKTEVCEWHLNAQVTKTQAGRMGVNTGSNAIGRGVAESRLTHRLVVGARGGSGAHRGGRTQSQGHGFDAASQSRYFMTSSGESQAKANSTKPGEFFQRSAASLLELDDDDPFIAEGRLSRDTESRLKKRLLSEEKERDIARKLTSMGSGGAGGEYLRHRIAPNSDGPFSTESANDETERKRSAMATKDNIMGPDRNGNGNRKRAANSVRLSPIKKTRFLTDKRVREAGRESMGGHRVDRDDDLDII